MGLPIIGIRPAPDPLAGAIIYDPYRDIVGRNLLPVGSENFVTGWSNAAGTTVTPVSVTIPGAGTVTAYRVQTIIETGWGKHFCQVLNPSVLGAAYAGGCWVFVNTGPNVTVSLNVGSSIAVAVADGWKFANPAASGDGTNAVRLSFGASTAVTNHLDFTAYIPQVNFTALAPYSAPSGLPQSLRNTGIGGSLHNAQLGSAAGADTNDPKWGAAGLVFGADDYLKITSSWFDDMQAFTVITALKAPTAQAYSPRIYDKAKKWLGLEASTNKLRSYFLRATDYQDCVSSGTLTAGTTYVTGFAVGGVGTVPDMYIGATKQTVTEVAAGSGAWQSDASSDLYVGNSSAANTSFLSEINYQVVFNRKVSPAQYLAAYRKIQRILAARGVTV